MELIGADVQDGADPRLALAQRNQEVRLLCSQVLQLRHEIINMRAEQERQMAILKRRFFRIDNNVARVANRPAYHVRRSSAGGHGGAPAASLTRTSNAATLPSPSRGQENTRTDQQQQPTLPAASEGDFQELDQESATTANDGPALDLAAEPGVQGQGLRTPFGVARLVKCPRTLHLLWREYMFGFSGYKPAREWTQAERGKDRFNFYRRNVFWSKVVEMVRLGYTAERAIDKIYSVYGHKLSVTNILNRMIKDKKDGGHPGLTDNVL